VADRAPGSGRFERDGGHGPLYGLSAKQDRFEKRG
jgi:hypothetical protein